MTIFIGIKDKVTGNITIGSDTKLSAGKREIKSEEKKYLIINGVYIGFLGIIYPRKILEYTIYDKVQEWLKIVKPTTKSDVFNFHTFLRNTLYDNFVKEYGPDKTEFDIVIVLPNRKMFLCTRYNDIEELDILVTGSGEVEARAALEVFLKHKHMFILEKNYSNKEIIQECIKITEKLNTTCGGKIFIEEFIKTKRS